MFSARPILRIGTGVLWTAKNTEGVKSKVCYCARREDKKPQISENNP